MTTPTEKAALYRLKLKKKHELIPYGFKLARRKKRRVRNKPRAISFPASYYKCY